ncbi:MAG: prefoldin subunit [Elusimicrobiota bacterium]
MHLISEIEHLEERNRIKLIYSNMTVSEYKEKVLKNLQDKIRSLEGEIEKIKKDREYKQKSYEKLVALVEKYF